MKQVHLIIYGRVQGVGFRNFVHAKALVYHIRGWVRNNFDETIEIVAQGDKKDIEAFAQCCKKGPAMSYVEEIKIFTEPLENLSGFSIK